MYFQKSNSTTQRLASDQEASWACFTRFGKVEIDDSRELTHTQWFAQPQMTAFCSMMKSGSLFSMAALHGYAWPCFRRHAPTYAYSDYHISLNEDHLRKLEAKQLIRLRFVVFWPWLGNYRTSLSTYKAVTTESGKAYWNAVSHSWWEIQHSSSTLRWTVCILFWKQEQNSEKSHTKNKQRLPVSRVWNYRKFRQIFSSAKDHSPQFVRLWRILTH